MYAAKERSLAVGLNFEILALNFVIGWLNFEEILVRWKLRPQSCALLALKT